MELVELGAGELGFEVVFDGLSCVLYEEEISSKE